MKRINETIRRIEYSVGTVMLIGIIVLVFASAFLRLVRFPIVWSVDASQLLFVWISMIGADIALKKGAHMGVDLLVRFFPEKIRKGLALFSILLCIAFALFIVYWGTHLCVTNHYRLYQTLGISYSFATAAVPFVSILMLMTLAEQLIDLLKTMRHPAASQASSAASV